MDLKDLYPVVLILVTVGVLLGVGIYTMSELRTQVATIQSGSIIGYNLSNERGDNSTVLNASQDNVYILTLNITNYTGNYQFVENTSTIAGNYSLNQDTGVITWLGLVTAYDEYFINMTYTFTYDEADSPEAAIQDALEGTAGFADWIAVIVVVIAAAIVLGIVLKSFGRKDAGV